MRLQQTNTRQWILALLALGCLTMASVAAAKRSGLFDQLDLLVDVRYEIVNEYVEQPDQKKMVDAAARAMVESLEDPYTVYLSAQDLEPFDKQIRGVFSGIGAEVDIHANHLRIVTPLDDSPAWKAGVMAGDLVLEIEGESVAEIFSKLESDAQKLREMVKRLQGEEGTKVRVKVRHSSGEEEHVAIMRAQINVPTVRGWHRNGGGEWNYMLDEESKLGYIRISQFTDKTADGVRGALDELVKKGMKGLVLDMRFNPGGLLDSAVQISDMFLDEGKKIVSVRGRIVPERTQYATGPGTIPPVPVVVLANEASASAAEVVTGALADNDRAKFIGTRTFGKGSVQQVKPLEAGGAIKLTNAYYYLPSGRNIHKRQDKDVWGVDPSEGCWVPMSSEETKQMLEIRRNSDVLKKEAQSAGESTQTPIWTAERIQAELKDPQLAAAVQALRGKNETGQWPVVGKNGSKEIVQLIKRENLLRQRDLLNERLEQINKEMLALASGEEEKKTGETTPAGGAKAPEEKETAAPVPGSNEPRP